MTEEEISVTLGQHSLTLKSLQRQVDELKAISKELRTMNLALTRLTDELRYTSGTLEAQDERISALEMIRTKRTDLIVSSVITAAISGIVGYLIAQFIG